MKLFKKAFRTGHVYAGPEPVKKEEFEMKDVYAGPEQMGVCEDNKNMKFEKCEEDLIDKTEFVKAKRVPTAREKNDPMEFKAVYAAPDVMEKLRVRDERVDNPSMDRTYPLNNADVNVQKFEMVYAAPDAFKGMMMNNMADRDETVAKEMASAGMQGSTGKANGAERVIITCSECGEKTRYGKFCECCGAVLKYSQPGL